MAGEGAATNKCVSSQQRALVGNVRPLFVRVLSVPGKRAMTNVFSVMKAIRKCSFVCKDTEKVF